MITQRDRPDQCPVPKMLQSKTAAAAALPRCLGFTPRQNLSAHCFRQSSSRQQPRQQQHWLGRGSSSVQPALPRRRQFAGGRQPQRQQQQHQAQQQRPRAADVVRGLAADDDDANDSSSLAKSTRWRSLASPYDTEIFLLAVPALFR